MKTNLSKSLIVPYLLKFSTSFDNSPLWGKVAEAGLTRLRVPTTSLGDGCSSVCRPCVGLHGNGQPAPPGSTPRMPSASTMSDWPIKLIQVGEVLEFSLRKTKEPKNQDYARREPYVYYMNNLHGVATLHHLTIYQKSHRPGDQSGTKLIATRQMMKQSNLMIILYIIYFQQCVNVSALTKNSKSVNDPIFSQCCDHMQLGRVVAKGIGGGIKHKYHWIQWIRDGPTDLNVPPKEEKVLAVFKDGCRTSFVALVGGDKKYPGQGGALIHAAGTCGLILKNDGDRVIVKMPSKKQFSLHQTCMATVGRLSNVLHGTTPIGSAQKNRELGNRPRSGLWQRKSGKHGRKIKPLPPIRKIGISEGSVPKREILLLNHRPLNTVEATPFEDWDFWRAPVPGHPVPNHPPKLVPVARTKHNREE
ncbi:39S ribosomal protein L2, mitochondrial [Melipona quadrifasciata]|uniref:39S ribosomal protein L2, mitochondrial n=1 Tax=Melipona quadrifasciata TaxID=166423 RepID=A0A0N0BKB1_9HYME|nr:39S ribosomal protein L2, mitochondrial [Melipona quadrifasciata]